MQIKKINNGLKNSLKKSNEINFIIEKNADKKPVGMISLVDIDHRSQKTEMGRVLIGDADERGAGIGSRMCNPPP